MHKSIQELLAPYLSDEFASPWREKFYQQNPAQWLSDQIRRFREVAERAEKYLEAYQNNNLVQSFFASFQSKPEWEDCFELSNSDNCLYEIYFLDALQRLIATYGEGAIVVLALLFTYSDIRLWKKIEYSSLYDHRPSAYCYAPISDFYDWEYDRISALYLPTLKKHSPLDILVTFREIEKILPHFDTADENREYMWYIEQFSRKRIRHCGLSSGYYNSFSFKEIETRLRGISPPGYGDKKEYVFYELETLNRKLELFPTRLSPWWVNSDPLVKLYLQNRAWDITKYGKPVADLTFPQPSIPGVAPVQISNMVDFMAKIFEETLKQYEIEPVEKRKKEHTKRVEEKFVEYMKHKIVPLPNLPLKTLTPDSREAVKKACLGELLQNGEGKLNVLGMLAAINEITDFCNLLSKPENHIKKPSGQYVEKEVPLRTEADMVGEMRRELTDLPNLTAYAKIMQVENGNQATAKHKINTPIWYELPEKCPGNVAAKIKDPCVNNFLIFHFKGTAL